MRAQGQGILETSQIFFYNSSSAENEVFLSPLCIGRYECDENYVVKRKNYDSYLLVYVQSGSAYIVIDGEEKTVRENEYFILDCYKPHEYGSREGCKMQWIHFIGNKAKEYYEYIVQLHQSNIIRPNDYNSCNKYFNIIYDSFDKQTVLPIPLISKYIVNSLTEFMYGFALQSNKSIVDDLEKSRIFILENFNQQLSLKDIAETAGISEYYFIRAFKKKYDFTPHEYLIKTRLETACFYLISSNMNIKEIAFNCGFLNESNFCAAFKKHYKQTPSNYRDQQINIKQKK